jgi:hypothetical protein
MNLRTLSASQAESLDWLWPSYLPAGQLVIIDGDPEQGKSLLMLDLAARLSRGREFPDGYKPPAPGHVVLLAGEDRCEDTVIPRLVAADADLDRIHLLSVCTKDQDDSPLSIPEHLGILRRAIRRTQARLVLIDPFTMFLNPGLAAGNDPLIRRKVLTPLQMMARDTRACIPTVRHITKASHRSPLCLGAGSMGIISATRVAYLIGRHPDDEQLRLLVTNKNALVSWPPTLAYRIVSAANGAPRIEWQGPSDIRAWDLTGARPHGGALQRAEDFLRSALADSPILRTDLLRRAAELGISERTLDRARAALKIKSNQFHQDGRNTSTWSLPETEYDWTKDERSRRIMEGLCRPLDRPPAAATPPTPASASPALPPERIAASDDARAPLPPELIAATDDNSPVDEPPPGDAFSAGTETPVSVAPPSASDALPDPSLAASPTPSAPEEPSSPAKEATLRAMQPDRLVRLTFTQRGSRTNGVIWGFFRNVGAKPAFDLVHGFRKGRRFIPQFRTVSLAAGAILARDDSGLPYDTDHGKDRDPIFLYCAYKNAHGDCFRIETPILWTQEPAGRPTTPGPERLLVGTATMPELEWTQVP